MAAITGQPVAAAEALDAVVPTFTRFGVSAAMAALYRGCTPRSSLAGSTRGRGRRRARPDAAQDVLRTLLAR
ncbi:MAG: hypothetical protein HS111_35610 [Kofleriaceae bacterium]|nr:hypothetical protein [Kofleriaceae bacterium]